MTGHDAEPRIAIHSGWDLDDSRSWSGVITPLVQEIEERHTLRRLPGLDVRDALVDRARTRLSTRPVLPRHSKVTARRRSRALRRLVVPAQTDLLVTVAASTDLVMRSETPVLQITDATFDAVAGFYPQFSGLSAESLRQGRWVERRSAAHTSHFLVASDWACRSLVQEVGVHSERVTVAPFGPGIVPPDELPPVRSSHDMLELLFVSSDWHRKNGDVALEVHASLNSQLPVRLTVVGDAPQLSHRPGVRTLGRVDPEQLSQLYLDSDALLEPSRANASGVVITDALAHGLPVLAAEVGGVPTLVRPGVGGWLIESESFVDDAVRILRAVDRRSLDALSCSAAADARERLSWRAWGRAFDQAVDAALGLDGR